MTSPIRFEQGARGCAKALSCGLTALYAQIKAGIAPPFVELGRTRVLPLHEIDGLNALRLAGVPSETIRSAVLKMVESRAHGPAAPSIVHDVVETALAGHRSAARRITERDALQPTT